MIASLQIDVHYNQQIFTYCICISALLWPLNKENQLFTKTKLLFELVLEHFKNCNVKECPEKPAFHRNKIAVQTRA
jgi:hypothetical protein